MPGAIIVASQSAGAGPGSPGVARSDLWLSREVQLTVGIGGNTSYSWELLAVPPGSLSAITGGATSTAAFTPDTKGTYRLRLTTNGGGPGNVQVLALRVRYSNTGTVLGRGWAMPAYGERAGEDNSGGNTRGYAKVLEQIITDLETELDGLVTTSANTNSAITALSYREIPVRVAEFTTLDTGRLKCGTVYLNLSKYPATLGAKARTLRLQAVVSATGAVDDLLVPWVAEVRLYDETHGVAVTGSTLSGPTGGDVSVPAAITSGVLTVGSSPGNLRSDTPTVYSVEVRALGTGVLAEPDHVTVHNVVVIVEYV